jgi:hypothetical protein
MNTNLPNSQASTQPGQIIVELINDIQDLTGKSSSSALSFTLAWRQHPNPQCQDCPFTQPERITP